MRYSLSEKKVLKKLGIPDFRHMTKEKIMSFATMLPYMDPEVAKQALDQFSDFKNLTTQLVIEYKVIVDKVLTENSASQNAFYSACNTILESLQMELHNENISVEEKERIEDQMIKVAKMIGEKDTENKKFYAMIITVSVAIASGITATASSLLGSNTQVLGLNDKLSNIGV